MHYMIYSASSVSPDARFSLVIKRTVLDEHSSLIARYYVNAIAMHSLGFEGNTPILNRFLNRMGKNILIRHQTQIYFLDPL